MPVPVIIAMEFAGKCMKCWAVAVQVFKKGQAKQDLHLVAGCFSCVSQYSLSVKQQQQKQKKTPKKQNQTKENSFKICTPPIVIEEQALQKV